MVGGGGGSLLPGRDTDPLVGANCTHTGNSLVTPRSTSGGESYHAMTTEASLRTNDQFICCWYAGMCHPLFRPGHGIVAGVLA